MFSSVTPQVVSAWAVTGSPQTGEPQTARICPAAANSAMSVRFTLRFLSCGRLLRSVRLPYASLHRACSLLLCSASGHHSAGGAERPGSGPARAMKSVVSSRSPQPDVGRTDEHHRFGSLRATAV